MVGVKTEIDTPFPDRSNEGKLEFFVDCSANATPVFEGRGGESLALEISNTLAKAYSSPLVFDLKRLSILRHQQCWKLYVDVLILECGGNLFDTVSMAVKAALFNTRIPKVKAAIMDGGNVDLTLSDDIYDCTRLKVDAAPVLVTLCKIGEHCVVDPSAEEEESSSATLVIGVSTQNDKGYVSTTRTTGTGSFHSDTLAETLKLGVSAGCSLNRELMRILVEEESKSTKSIGKKEIVGFLK